MKLVAIAGPYRSATEWGVSENIRRAELAAVAVWQLGAAAICPHKNTAFFGGAAPDATWLEGALEMVRRSDAVLTVAGWEASEGARNELSLAEQLGLPVFHSVEELERWLRSQG
jgi:hypothetical protein